MLKLYITEAPFPTSPEDLAAAEGAGACQVVHVNGGYPEWLTAISVSAPGYHEIEEEADTLDGKRAAKRAELDAFNLVKATTPFSWDFTGTAGVGDDGTEYADVGVQTLQIAGLQDQSNWTAVGSTSGLSVLAGQGASSAPMKCSANIWIASTAAQAFEALVTGKSGALGLLGRQQNYLKRYGQLKRAIENAADVDALDAIDITAGWD